MPRYPLLPKCIFRETFDSLSSVAQNGGTLTGTPIVNKGVTLVSDNATHFSYAKSAPTANKTKMSVRIRILTGPEVTTITDIIDKWDASAYNQFICILQSSALTMYVANALTDAGGNVGFSNAIIAPNTEYEIVWVYDGTLAAANRLKLYVNKAATTVTISGTIPTSLTRSNFAVTSGGYGTTSRSKSGHKFRSIELFDGALTQEEINDLYENDTITELDASKSLVTLPLKSWYWKENGTELLVDYDMEAADTAAWSNVQATLTKETGTPHSGSRCLRIGFDGVGGHTQAVAFQTNLVVGKRYKITGYARGDGLGTTVPWVVNSSITFWAGTNSNAWQYFEVEIVPTTNAYTMLYAQQVGAAGRYVEFDDVSVQLMEARTDNIGSLGGYALLGDGSTTTTFPTQIAPHGMSFDTGDKLVLNNSFNGLGALSCGFLINWFYYTGSIRYPLSNGKTIIFVDGTNRRITFSSNNSTVALGDAGAFQEGWNSVICTRNSDGTLSNIYINGNLNGTANQTSGTPIAGTQNFTFGDLMQGKMKNPFIFPFEITPLQAAYLHNQMMKTLNV